MLSDKSVLTIATGKQVYINMTVALARSFYVWNKNNGIRFFIATDQQNLISDDVLAYAHIIPLAPKQFGEGFSTKLHLDKMAVTQKTLFIDSDCLITGDLRFVFDKFNEKSVSVIGGYISDGEWFGDIASICTKFNIQAMPKFNGGIYYLEKGELSTRIYDKARELESQYEEIGFKLLRNRPNDELLMSLAMALNNQSPVTDDGTVMSDPQACPGKMSIDVFDGKSLLINPLPSEKNHQNWYPFHKVSPAVVHFLGYYTSKFPYTREEKKLQMVFEKEISLKITNIIIFINITIPTLIKENIKDTLRPIYHKLFGYRKIKASNRIN